MSFSAKLRMAETAINETHDDGMNIDPLSDHRYDADHIGEMIDDMKKSGYEYDEPASRSVGVPVFAKDGLQILFNGWDDVSMLLESRQKPEYGLGVFEVTLMREIDGARQTETIEIEAEGATIAYVKAMKAHNASEMWTPVSWKRKSNGGNQTFTAT